MLTVLQAVKKQALKSTAIDIRFTVILSCHSMDWRQTILTLPCDLFPDALEKIPPINARLNAALNGLTELGGASAPL